MFASVAGRRFLDLALASLAPAERVSVLLGSADRVARHADALPTGAIALADDRPGRGPLSGLATALRAHPDGWTALLAADLPLVPRVWWPTLAARFTPGVLAIVPRAGDGRWEPLAALYHGALAPAVAAAVAGDDPARWAFQPWLSALADTGQLLAVDVASLPEGALLNVNRPEDAEALIAFLREASPPGEARREP